MTNTSDNASGFRLSPLAEIDLEGIWFSTFETWSTHQADRYHADIMSIIADLAKGRKKGRPVDVRAGYFKYPVG